LPQKIDHNLLYALFCSLDLDLWINDPPSESSEDEDVSDVGARDIFVKIDRLADGISSANNHNKQSELTEEELEKVNFSTVGVNRM
jgi:hypothetical protein